jgi:hypothetical protein
LDKKHAHLQMIRSIVNRMLLASFVLKLWSIATVAALLAVATNPAYTRYAWLALFMALTFWMLDAHFSRQRRLFRKTYERVQALDESQVDFNMDTAPVDSEATAWGSLLFSKALAAFYGTVVALIVFVRLVLARGG